MATSTAIVVLVFVVGLLLGRLSSRFAFQWYRDAPPDYVTPERLKQLRRY